MEPGGHGRRRRLEHLTVVGVVRSVRFAGVDDQRGLDVYAPNTQMYAGDAFFAVRTQTSPSALASQVRAAIDQVDRDQSFFDPATMGERVGDTLWQHRVSTFALAMFAAVALVLAVIGTYAVTAHAVAAQRREIGLRLTLGSSSRGIAWLVARIWIVPIGVGVAAGLAAGAFAAQIFSDMIGVRVAAIGWPLALPALLAVAAMMACGLPVRRLLRSYQLNEALRTP